MDSTIGDMIAEGWLIIYMDNILIFAETLEECQEQTRRVLDRMKEEDLHLKLAKCAFNQTEVEYLGLVVRNGEVLMDPTKLKAVEQWEPLRLVKVVRFFIGFCNFYRKFIPNFSAIAQPLHNLTKKGVVFHWGKEQDNAFIKLKEMFLSTPVLRGLHNLISSSAHSSVVRGHIEFRTLGSSSSGNKKSARLKSHWESQGGD